MKRKAAQPELLKELNRSQVFGVLQRRRRLSRPQLASETGLSRTTVGSLIEALIGSGLVRDIGEGRSTGGRRPSLLEFNPDAALVLGAYLDQGFCSVVATDLDARAVARQEAWAAGGSPEAAIQALQNAVVAIRSQVEGRRVLPAIGLATPGHVDSGAGMIKTAPEMGWFEIPIVQMVTSALGVKALVANRARAGALAERWYGVGRNVDDLIYISIGNGIAAGIVHGDSLYQGTNASAGALGHTTILPDGPLCTCGNHGCLTTLASESAIASRARARLREGRTTTLVQLAGGDPDHITSQTVFKAAEQSDALALEVVEEVSGYLGIAIANLINLLNPAMVVLGGPVGRAGHVLIAPLWEEIKRRARPAPLSAVRMVTSSLGNDTEAIGGAALVLQQAQELLFSV